MFCAIIYVFSNAECPNIQHEFSNVSLLDFRHDLFDTGFRFAEHGDDRLSILSPNEPGIGSALFILDASIYGYYRIMSFLMCVEIRSSV